ncbi:hypothetical protein PSYJA_43271, partial [Pseudomonas syringae pv. japonica str. M301072]
ICAPANQVASAVQASLWGAVKRVGDELLKSQFITVQIPPGDTLSTN